MTSVHQNIIYQGNSLISVETLPVYSPGGYQETYQTPPVPAEALVPWKKNTK